MSNCPALSYDRLRDFCSFMDAKSCGTDVNSTAI
jgi:hypothetical protein